MYKFRKLTGKYRMEVTNTSPGRKGSKYSSVVELSASYQNMENYYLFEIRSRNEALLDSNPPGELMDLLMLRLSSAYYPMRLKVSAEGELMDICGFDGIRERWEREADAVLKESPCLAYQQYINRMKDNMGDKSSFLQVLQRDSFVQFYFAGEKEAWDIACCNFPGNGMTSYCRLHEENGDMEGTTRRRYASLEGDADNIGGHASIEYSENRDVVSVNAMFQCKAEGEVFMKSFSLSAIERDGIRANKVASFLFD
jgi:hypothetical protein